MVAERPPGFEGVVRQEFREERKIAVARKQRLNGVRNAYGRDAGIVDDPADNVRPVYESLQDVPKSSVSPIMRFDGDAAQARFAAVRIDQKIGVDGDHRVPGSPPGSP